MQSEEFTLFARHSNPLQTLKQAFAALPEQSVQITTFRIKEATRHVKDSIDHKNTVITIEKANLFIKEHFPRMVSFNTAVKKIVAELDEYMHENVVFATDSIVDFETTNLPGY